MPVDIQSSRVHLTHFGREQNRPLMKIRQREQVINRLYTEVSRKTTRKRIENPDDASQYVEVERIDEITFSGPSENGASVNVTFKFNWVN